MPVVLAGVVAREEYFDPGNLNEEHSSTQNMTSRVRRDADRGNGMCGVVVNSFDLGKRVQVIGFCVKLRSLFGGGSSIAITSGKSFSFPRLYSFCLPDPDAVLDEPLIDGFCRMGHENSAAEVCFRQNIGE